MTIQKLNFNNLYMFSYLSIVVVELRGNGLVSQESTTNLARSLQGAPVSEPQENQQTSQAASLTVVTWIIQILRHISTVMNSQYLACYPSS